MIEPAELANFFTIFFSSAMVIMLGALYALLFAYSALVQLNDPDPVRWFALYGSAALLSAATVFASVPPVAFLGLACVAGLWAATLAPGVLSLAAFTGTEEERELGGLLLVVLASLVLRSRAR